MSVQGLTYQVPVRLPLVAVPLGSACVLQHLRMPNGATKHNSEACQMIRVQASRVLLAVPGSCTGAGLAHPPGAKELHTFHAFHTYYTFHMPFTCVICVACCVHFDTSPPPASARTINGYGNVSWGGM